MNNAADSLNFAYQPEALKAIGLRSTNSTDWASWHSRRNIPLAQGFRRSCTPKRRVWPSLSLIKRCATRRGLAMQFPPGDCELPKIERISTSRPIQEEFHHNDMEEDLYFLGADSPPCRAAPGVPRYY